MQRIGASASSNEHGLPAKMIRLTREMTPKGTQACGLCAQRVSQPADLGIGPPAFFRHPSYPRKSAVVEF